MNWSCVTAIGTAGAENCPGTVATKEAGGAVVGNEDVPFDAVGGGKEDPFAE